VEGVWIGLSDDNYTVKQAHKPPDLQAVIKETLGILLFAELGMSRVKPRDGLKLAGYFLEVETYTIVTRILLNSFQLTKICQTSVGVNAWVAHANQLVFGADDDVSHPERWLASMEEVNKMDQYFFAIG